MGDFDGIYFAWDVQTTNRIRMDSNSASSFALNLDTKKGEKDLYYLIEMSQQSKIDLFGFVCVCVC